MGYYLKTSMIAGKAKYLIAECGAMQITEPISVAGLPAGKAVVMVIENRYFDAAGHIYNNFELRRMKPTDHDRRKRTWLLMDESKVIEMIGIPSYQEELKRIGEKE